MSFYGFSAFSFRTFLPVVMIGMLMIINPVLPQASTSGFVAWGIAIRRNNFDNRSGKKRIAFST